MTAPAHSATVILLRPAAPFEVLMVRRSEAMRFYGGAWVFPGGRVDPEERSGDPIGDAKRAAVRELREETALQLEPAALAPLSRWTTPVERPRRYETWFFLAPDPGRRVEVDGVEIVEHRWSPPAAMLEERARGALVLPPPVFVTLHVLSSAESLDDALALAGGEPMIYEPRIGKTRDGHASLYAGDAGFEHTEPSAPGPRHRLEMSAARWRYLRDP